MDMKKVVLVLGLLVAVIAALIKIPYIALLLVLLGLVKGAVYVDESDQLFFMVLAVALASVAGSLDVIPGLGPYLTAMLTNISAFISTAALAVILKFFMRKIMD